MRGAKLLNRCFLCSMLAGAILICCGAAALAAGSGVITFQGQVRGVDGKPPADGSYTMMFSFYNVASGGDASNMLWTSTYADVDMIAVKNGLINVHLGSLQPFPPNLFSDNPNLWLEIQIDMDNNGFGAGETYSPRMPLTVTAFAFHADTATTATFALNAGAANFAAEATHASSADTALNADNATNAANAINAVNTANATNAINAENADTLDNQHASDFAATNHDHNLQDLAGAVTDNQVPDNITISHASSADTATNADSATNASNAVNATNATNAENATNADTVDNQHASDFAAAAHGHNLQDLAGAVTDDQIPNNITIDHAATAGAATNAANATNATNATNAVNATNAANANNADTVDLKHASDFASSVHDHNLQDLPGAVTDAQVPDDITVNNAANATFATLAQNSINAAHASDVLRIVKELEANESIAAGDVVGFENGKVRKGFSRINSSPEYIFKSGSTYEMATAGLSGDTFVVAYRDNANSDYGTAIVGTVTDSGITYGSPAVFNNANSTFFSIAALSYTQFVIAYKDNGNSGYGMVIIGTVSGTTISYGPEILCNAWTTGYCSVAALSSSKIVVAYTNYHLPSYGVAVIGDVSGSTITAWGNEYTFNSATTSFNSVAALSDNQFVVAYRDEGNSEYGTARVGTVSDFIIGYGSETVFNTSNLGEISIAALSNEKVAVVYRDDGNSDFGTIIIGAIAGDTISFGPEQVFNSGATYFTNVQALTNNKIAVAYCDNGFSDYGTMMKGNVSGWSVGFGQKIFFNNGATHYLAISALTETRFIVAYRDHGNSGYGTAVLGYFFEPFGIAAQSASGGENVPVIFHGISDNHSGLMPGFHYYANSDGSLTKVRSDYCVGIALSPTELLLELGR